MNIQATEGVPVQGVSEMPQKPAVSWSSDMGDCWVWGCARDVNYSFGIL